MYALQLAGRVLCNILRGHKQIYDVIKSMPGGDTTAVGIVHNVFWLEPKGQGPLYAHVRCCNVTCVHFHERRICQNARPCSPVRAAHPLCFNLQNFITACITSAHHQARCQQMGCGQPED